MISFTFSISCLFQPFVDSIYTFPFLYAFSISDFGYFLDLFLHVEKLCLLVSFSVGQIG